MTYETYINSLETNGKIGREDAEKVFAVYKKHKAHSFNAHDGYRIKHGAFFDRDVIIMALEEK